MILERRPVAVPAAGGRGTSSTRQPVPVLPAASVWQEAWHRAGRLQPTACPTVGCGSGGGQRTLPPVRCPDLSAGTALGSRVGTGPEHAALGSAWLGRTMATLPRCHARHTVPGPDRHADVAGAGATGAACSRSGRSPHTAWSSPWMQAAAGTTCLVAQDAGPPPSIWPVLRFQVLLPPSLMSSTMGVPSSDGWPLPDQVGSHAATATRLRTIFWWRAVAAEYLPCSLVYLSAGYGPAVLPRPPRHRCR